MEKLLLIVLSFAIGGWAIPRPMESIENYNVLMVHGAYGSNKGFEKSASGYLADSIKNDLTESLKIENPQLYDEYQTYPRTVGAGQNQLVVTKDMWLFENFPELIDSIERVQGDFEKGYDILSAYDRAEFLGDATLGGYNSNDRITKWLSMNVFEEPDIGDERNPRNSYVYNWRSFSDPANSSYNNAFELADRTWNKGNKPFHQGGFGHRRALMEEAQEVKSEYSFFDKSLNKDVSLYGQEALDSMRHHPDLYRQLASRYILIGHSMGGVVSREYVQGNFYNGDVDKIITLDTPHEGTGALNMLIDKSIREEALLDQALTNFIKAAPLAAGLATTLFLTKGLEPAIYMGIVTLAGVMAVEEVGNALTYAFAPEIYYYNDPLVHYVDPRQTGFGTIDSLNKLDYSKKLDSLPMFRILASQHGMTFSDPDLVDFGSLDFVRSLIPDNFTLPLANYGAQLTGTGDWSARTVNALVSSFIGFGGMPMQDNGSNIVPAASSEGRNVDILNDNRVDVERKYFNAAPAASGEVAEFAGEAASVGDLLSVLEVAAAAMLVIDAFAWTGVSDGAKIALGVGTAVVASSYIGAALSTGIYDLVKSHSIPLQKNYLDDMKVSKNTFSPIGSSAGSSYTPYLMEDFLYEKPFVNLALNDSKTMDSLSKMNEDARESSTLNRSCFYGADADSSTQLCEVGLYGADGKTVDMARERNYSAFKGSPLKFSSSSDWEKFGVKVDRWERVDGLKPDGSENPGGVPIRHVERYNVPAITVDNWIEKYSFVVDDLMPHRLRQIRMNFNYQEEIAWECDVTKDPDANDACSVFKRSGGGNWKLADSIGNKGYVPHPVKKNGQFDFEPGKYGIGNLLAIQKDNQNTVTVSTVNKIGLSNTLRFLGGGRLPLAATA